MPFLATFSLHEIMRLFGYVGVLNFAVFLAILSCLDFRLLRVSTVCGDCFVTISR